MYCTVQYLNLLVDIREGQGRPVNSYKTVQDILSIVSLRALHCAALRCTALDPTFGAGAREVCFIIEHQQAIDTEAIDLESDGSAI